MIAVIHGGRLQQYGTPQEVYARPANRVVADFMGLVNLCPATGDRPGHDRSGRRAQAPGSPARPASGAGDKVEVSIRPENIRLNAAGNGARAPPSASAPSSATSASIMPSLDSGPTLRVQTHPGQVFAVGDKVAVEIDATQCSVFRSSAH